MKPSSYFAMLTALICAAEGFVHNQHQSRMRVESRTATLVVQGGSYTALSVGDMPYGPPSGASSSGSNADGNSSPSDPSAVGAAAADTNEGGTLRGNRFSKYAPDASLDTAEFREQLKENMKADLERRRREDPSRGNQPAKTYLDNL